MIASQKTMFVASAVACMTSMPGVLGARTSATKLYYTKDDWYNKVAEALNNKGMPAMKKNGQPTRKIVEKDQCDKVKKAIISANKDFQGVSEKYKDVKLPEDMIVAQLTKFQVWLTTKDSFGTGPNKKGPKARHVTKRELKKHLTDPLVELVKQIPCRKVLENEIKAKQVNIKLNEELYAAVVKSLDPEGKPECFDSEYKSLFADSREYLRTHFEEDTSSFDRMKGHGAESMNAVVLASREAVSLAEKNPGKTAGAFVATAAAVALTAYAVRRLRGGKNSSSVEEEEMEDDIKRPSKSKFLRYGALLIFIGGMVALAFFAYKKFGKQE